MVKIAVFISGGGTNLQSLIDAVQNKYIDGEISLVISSKENAYGLERARLAGITVLPPFQLDAVCLIKVVKYIKYQPQEICIQIKLLIFIQH